ncbi:hypothetical protein LOTGIDRAFT_213890 [Lottia gigantea]|uniref:Uncharacterized protein n=1 Tax=Lottia gigantea TaxID=225164 RepID=V4A322_LOTGI|nr:hypothetical protein LOTGIDRAFT_213890 [Lottia gigantea]ESO98258.1 hypothetical protein LOTGIDRAFT_213890 [Lottia gigantea]
MSRLAIFVLCFTIVNCAEDVGWFWHVTDFHYDFSYWTDQLSCNDVVTSPGIFGDYWCDSPWLLIKDSIEGMKGIKSKVDFVLWTGDNIAHIKDENLTLEMNIDSINNITNELKRNFPGIKVYATLGNHDYLPNNQFPPTTNEIYNQIGDMWKDWIGETAQVNQFKTSAYYSLKTVHGLRILGLNTNLYYTSNKVTPNVTDPAGQFQWLDQQLAAAKTNKEKVIITAHIPPGIHTPANIVWFYKQFNDKFLEVIDKHVDSGIIVGMYYGHDHSDGFKVYYNSKDEPAFPIHSAPSVTPWRYKIPEETGDPHNPGVKLVSYNRTTGEPLNIKMYYIDLPDSNSKNKTEWKLEYDFNDVYKTKDVGAASIDDLAKRMTKDRSLIQMYYKYKDVSAGNSGKCDTDCEESILCGFKYYKMSELENCKTTFTNASARVTSTSLIIEFVVTLVTLLITLRLR